MIAWRSRRYKMMTDSKMRAIMTPITIPAISPDLKPVGKKGLKDYESTQEHIACEWTICRLPGCLQEFNVIMKQRRSHIKYIDWTNIIIFSSVGNLSCGEFFWRILVSVSIEHNHITSQGTSSTSLKELYWWQMSNKIVDDEQKLILSTWINFKHSRRWSLVMDK